MYSNFFCMLNFSMFFILVYNDNNDNNDNTDIICSLYIESLRNMSQTLSGPQSTKLQITDLIERGHPSYRSALPLGIATVISTLFFLAMSSIDPRMIEFLLYFVDLSGVFPIVFGISFVLKIINTYKTHFEITKELIYVRKGLIPNKQIYDVKIEDISTVAIKQGMLGNLLNYGTLELITSKHHNKRITIPDIVKPLFIKNALDNIVLGTTSEYFEKHVNTNMNLEILYPKSWTVTALGTGIMFYLNTLINNQSNKVMLVIDTIKNLERIDNKKSLLGMNNQKTLEDVLQKFKKSNDSVASFVIHDENRNSSISGNLAHSITYSMNSYGVEIKGTFFVVVVGNIGYELIYQAPLNLYPKYASHIEKMLDSLRIKQ